MIKFCKILDSQFDLDLAFLRSSFPFKNLVPLGLKSANL